VRPNRPEPDRGAEGHDGPIRYLVHDRDKRFCPVFDEVFRAEGIEILRTPWRAPRANAYAERFIRTVRTECLDRVFLLGERHRHSVLETYVEHYNRERPHRLLDLVARRERKTSRRSPSTTRSDAGICWVACFTSTTEERRRPIRSGHPPASIKPSEILETRIGRAPGKIGFLGVLRSRPSHAI